ncbi:MAG: DNA recombination protein RmuC, partial [Flavobacteriia bacterium]|nr:DNA recombination protein RmuC [Flavobacteriia bacterium]
MPYTDVIFPLLIVVLLAYIILKMRKGNSGVVAGSEELPGWAEQQLAEGKAKVEALSQELKSKEEALVQLQISSAQEIAGLKGQLNAATEKLDTIQKLHQEQKAEAVKSKEAMKNEFKVLAESILEEKKKQFKTTNSEELDKLLAPFKQKLEDFEKTVKDNHEKEVKSTSVLMENIKSLKDMNDKLSEEASGLAKALRGDNKKQGNWGEFVLERALEMSGLQKDKEYFVQNS